MESRVMEAKARHDRGFNCCQAVACTYCDLFGMDEETAFKACEAFGAGMGGMEGTCGAVSGAVFLAEAEKQLRRSGTAGEQGKNISAIQSHHGEIPGKERESCLSGIKGNRDGHTTAVLRGLYSGCSGSG